VLDFKDHINIVKATIHNSDKPVSKKISRNNTNPGLRNQRQHRRWWKNTHRCQ